MYCVSRLRLQGQHPHNGRTLKAALEQVDILTDQRTDIAVLNACGHNSRVILCHRVAVGQNEGLFTLMFAVSGEHVVCADLSPRQVHAPFQIDSKRNRSVPVYFPEYAPNRLSVSAITAPGCSGRSKKDRRAAGRRGQILLSA